MMHFHCKDVSVPHTQGEGVSVRGAWLCPSALHLFSLDVSELPFWLSCLGCCEDRETFLGTLSTGCALIPATVLQRHVRPHKAEYASPGR